MRGRSKLVFLIEYITVVLGFKSSWITSLGFLGIVVVGCIGIG